MQRQIRSLYEHLGLSLDEPGSDLPSDVLDLIRSGDRMGAAVKLSKETGMPFVEARKKVNEV